MMVDDIHLRIDRQLNKRLEELAKVKNITKASAMRYLIMEGLDSEELIKYIKINESRLKRIEALIKQLYSDLEMVNTTNPNQNKALQNFYKKYEKSND